MPDEPRPSSFRTALGIAIERLAVASLIGTVCLLPWWLGGVIPFARLILQVGSCIAMGLALLAALIRGHRLQLPVREFWFLIAFASIGVVQLLPIFPPISMQMQHAVFPEFQSFATSDGAGSSGDEVTSNHVRSTAPSLTRFQAAQWLSVAVLFCAAFDLLRSKRRVILCFSAMVINAVVLTLVALLQIFGDGKMIVGGGWMRSTTVPFGTFVNPNNAAGWLLIHLATSIGLLILVWGRSPFGLYSRIDRRPAIQDRLAMMWGRVLQRVASLNNWQILAAIASALLIAGAAATLSRAGITAGIVCLVAAMLSRITQRYSIFSFVVPILMLLVSSIAILTVFDLDTLVISELKTLKDPVSQSTGRLLHWNDTIRVAMDFPVLGAGQGTYRFVTLPYLRRWVPAWFKNADNQYLEILVESGVVGVLLFCALGFSVLTNSWRLTQSDKSASAQRANNTTLRLSLGVAGIAMIVSQTFAMLFDFGIGLPATSAGIVVVAGMIAGAGVLRNVDEESSQSGMTMPLTAWVVRCCCLVAAAAFVPDLVHAHQIYWPVVQAEKAIRPPITRQALEKLPELRQQLVAGLKDRPDDVDGWSTLVAVTEAEFRLDLIESLSMSPPEDKQLQAVWDGMSPFPLTILLERQKKSLTSQSMEETRTVLNGSLSRHDWLADSQASLSRIPLMPGLRAEAIAMNFARLGDPPPANDLKGLLFTDPANAPRITMAGNVSFFANDDEWARLLWQRSNFVSEVFRSEILTAASEKLPHADCLKEFAPAAYEDTVPVALKVQEPGLREALWGLADEQWQRLVAENLTDRQRVVRAQQLQVRRSVAEALTWIEESLVELPENLELRRMRADLLEQAGRFQDAMGEWYRIEYLDPENRSVESALRRLSQKQ